MAPPGVQGGWISIDQWPKITTLPVYFGRNTLQLTPPKDTIMFDYIYDPSNPVTTKGGNNLVLECGPYDQRTIEQRSDVILFNTDVLQSAIVIVGAIKPTLFVSSNATDTDFTIKVTDVYPDGTSMLVQDGIIRMRWRNDDQTPVLMERGQKYQVQGKISTVAYTFGVGHRIRVAISSSNNPRFGRNANNGLPLDKGDDGPLIIAQNYFYTGGDYASRIDLPIATGEELFKYKV
jgi:hypothetical protein